MNRPEGVGRTVLFPSLWCLFLFDLARGDLFARRLQLLLFFNHLLLWHDSGFRFRGGHGDGRLEAKVG